MSKGEPGRNLATNPKDLARNKLGNCRMDLRVRPGRIGTDSEVHPTKLFFAKS